MKLIQIKTMACDGTDVFWTWILWLLGAFILGLILGWLLRQIFGGAAAVAAKQDNTREDLTKIEGIGEKIQGLLYKAGIYNYAQLAASSQETLQKILSDAGPQYIVHKPYTWSAQASLANSGQWEELEKWQDMLKGGV
jgi:hypothetical protein